MQSVGTIRTSKIPEILADDIPADDILADDILADDILAARKKSGEKSIAKYSKARLFSAIKIPNLIMSEEYDREKIIDCMFDPVTSSILAELEDGEKECLSLAEQSGISESEVLERLSYLIRYGFISKNDRDGKCLLGANSEKLSSIVEAGDNFDAAVSGLEKMDSYLN